MRTKQKLKELVDYAVKYSSEAIVLHSQNPEVMKDFRLKMLNSHFDGFKDTKFDVSEEEKQAILDEGMKNFFKKVGQ